MDIGQLLLENLDLILIVVVGGLALFILRPVLMELARGARENIPPGAVDSIIKGITPILYDAIDGKLSELETATRDDSRTTLDEAVVAELRGAIRELRDIIVGANAMAAREELTQSDEPKGS
jgi:hypothetical protein